MSIRRHHRHHGGQPPANLSFVTTTLQDATLQTPYSFQLVGLGGTPPQVFGLSSGAFPTGVSMTSAGLISGKPTVSGDFDLTITMSDTGNTVPTISQSFVFHVIGAALVWQTTSPLPNAAYGVNYQLQLQATGGTPPYQFVQVQGNLPAGLSPGATDGLIRGRPTNAAGEVTSTKWFLGDVVSAPAIARQRILSLTSTPQIVVPTPYVWQTTSPLPAASYNSPYSYQLQASGGTPPYVFQLAQGSLPAGLTSDSTGLISGKPTNVAGEVTSTRWFLGDALNAPNLAHSLILSLTSNPVVAPLAWSSTSPLAPATYNASYTNQLLAAGGTPPYVFTRVGALPTGLVSDSTGLISGTPINAAGQTVNLSWLLGDALNAPSISRAFTLVSNATASPISIAESTPLPNAQVNTPYSTPLHVTNGSGSYLWHAVDTDLLPNGMVIDVVTGTISGTPFVVNTFTFTVHVVDRNTGATADKDYTITVGVPPVAIATITINAGQQQVSYSQDILAVNGNGSYTWALTSGVLPAGIISTVSANPGSKLTLSGTPTAYGTYSLTYQVTDGLGGVASQTFSLLIAPMALAFTNASFLPSAVQGTAYGPLQLAAIGGVAPYTFSFASGNYPAGLIPITSAGVISGTPTTSQSAVFTARVTDSATPTANVTTKQFILQVLAPAFAISTSSLAQGMVNTPYSQTLQAIGGVAPYTWAVSAGTLPTGISLTAATGVLGPFPTAANAGTLVTFQCTDSSASPQVVTRQLNMVVVAKTLVVSTTTLTAGTVGTSYSFTLVAAGGTAPRTWLANGAIPGWMSISAAGVVSGIPSATFSSTIPVKVTDSLGTFSTASPTLTVTASTLAISTASLVNGTVGSSYSQPLVAANGTPPYTWGVSGQPLGLSINGQNLQGTPTTAGNASVTLTVLDSVGGSASTTLPLVVVAALTGTADFIYRSTLKDVVMRTNFPNQASVDLYAGYHSGAAPNRNNIKWVSASDPTYGGRVLSGYAGAMLLVIPFDHADSDSTGQSFSDSAEYFHHALNDAWNIGAGGDPKQGFGPGDEFWFYDRVQISQYFADSNWDHWSGSGGWKIMLLDKWYKQSTGQEIVNNNNHYWDMISGYHQDGTGAFVNWETFFNASICAPGSDYKEQPAIDHQSAATHPAGLDPANYSGCAKNRVEFGGLYSQANATSSNPRLSDQTSGAMMFRRDLADRWGGILHHVKIGTWGGNDTVWECWAHQLGKDYLKLFSSNTVKLGAVTGTSTPGIVNDAYGNPGVIDPTGNPNNSHKINGCTITFYNTSRKANSNHNPAGDHDAFGLHQELICKTGPGGFPAPGLTVPPQSAYSFAPYLPSSPGVVSELTTGANGNPHMFDALPAAWQGGTAGGYDGYGVISYSGPAWDYDNGEVRWFDPGGHAATYVNPQLRLKWAGATQHSGWILDDVSDYATVVANLGSYSNQAPFGPDGRPGSVHTYGGTTITPDGRGWIMGGSTQPSGGQRKVLVAIDMTKSIGAGRYTNYGEPASPFNGNFYGHELHYCPINKKILCYLADSGEFCTFDPYTNTWGAKSSYLQLQNSGGAAVVSSYDWRKQCLIVFGAITNGKTPKQYLFNGMVLTGEADMGATGDTTGILAAAQPGVCFDPEIAGCHWGMNMSIGAAGAYSDKVWKIVGTGAFPYAWTFTQKTLTGTAIPYTNAGNQSTDSPKGSFRQIGVIRNTGCLAIINYVKKGVYVFAKPT